MRILQTNSKTFNFSLVSMPVKITTYVAEASKSYAIAEASDEDPKLWQALRVPVNWRVHVILQTLR